MSVLTIPICFNKLQFSASADFRLALSQLREKSKRFHSLLVLNKAAANVLISANDVVLSAVTEENDIKERSGAGA